MENFNPYILYQDFLCLFSKCSEQHKQNFIHFCCTGIVTEISQMDTVPQTCPKKHYIGGKYRFFAHTL